MGTHKVTNNGKSLFSGSPAECHQWLDDEIPTYAQGSYRIEVVTEPVVYRNPPLPKHLQREGGLWRQDKIRDDPSWD